MSAIVPQLIALALIRENPVALRGVDRDSEGYRGLVDSIKQKGFNGAITVRPMRDNEKNEDYFEILDGLHRFNACRDNGLTEIPCIVKTMTKEEAMEWQVMANVHKIETKPVEFMKQLQRMIAMSPTVTMGEWATRLAKSPGWITQQLGLLKLGKDIQKLVDDGKVPVSNAIALSKLPGDEQPTFLDRAMTLPPSEFVPQANQRAKEIREARKQGREAAPPTFQPVAVLQKLATIKSEYENPTAIRALILESGVTDPVEAAKLAVAWTLNLDPKSADDQRRKHEEREAKKAEEKAKRDKERADKKAKELADKAAEAAKTAASLS
jgi:ParB/RepB/Spo0J family partition protein